MNKSDLYYWRLFSTILCFISFGFGGLILRFLIFPMMQLLPGKKIKKIQRSRFLIHCLMRIFILQMKYLGILTYNDNGIRGKTKKTGLIIIANHPTLIDVIFLLSFIEQACCIVRGDLFKNPFIFGPLKNAGYIPNINPSQLIEDACKCLHEKSNLIIFPEGTRTPVNAETVRLHRGAANISLAAGINPIPIIITCKPITLSKTQKWFHIPEKRPHWSFNMGEPIPIPEGNRNPRNSKLLNRQFMAHFFEQRHDT